MLSNKTKQILKKPVLIKNMLTQIRKERNSKEPQDLSTVWQEEPVGCIWILAPEGCLSGVPEQEGGHENVTNVSYPWIQDIILCHRDSINTLLGWLLKVWKIYNGPH